MIPGELQSAWRDSDEVIQSLMESYSDRLNQVLLQADESLLGWLDTRASVGGELGGPRFREVMAALDRDAIAGALRQAGWDDLQGELSGAYREALDAAIPKYAGVPFEDFGGPFLRALEASLDADLYEFQRLGMDLVGRLKGQIEQMAVSPISVRDAAGMLASQTGTTLARAQTLVNTGLAGVQRRLHSEVAAVIPEEDLVRLYLGPDDKVIRPFCRALVGKALTDEQISMLDNGSGLPVISYCGGYNCRHDMIPVTRAYAIEAGVEFATDADIEAANG